LDKGTIGEKEKNPLRFLKDAASLVFCHNAGNDDEPTQNLLPFFRDLGLEAMGDHVCNRTLRLNQFIDNLGAKAANGSFLWAKLAAKEARDEAAHNHQPLTKVVDKLR
jgi:hypothetical protein